MASAMRREDWVILVTRLASGTSASVKMATCFKCQELSQELALSWLVIYGFDARAWTYNALCELIDPCPCGRGKRCFWLEATVDLVAEDDQS